MKEIITINIPEWFLYFVATYLSLVLVDSVLNIYKKYLQWRTKKRLGEKLDNIKLESLKSEVDFNEAFKDLGEAVDKYEFTVKQEYHSLCEELKETPLQGATIDEMIEHIKDLNKKFIHM